MYHEVLYPPLNSHGGIHVLPKQKRLSKFHIPQIRGLQWSKTEVFAVCLLRIRNFIGQIINSVVKFTSRNSRCHFLSLSLEQFFYSSKSLTKSSIFPSEMKFSSMDNVIYNTEGSKITYPLFKSP